MNSNQFLIPFSTAVPSLAPVLLLALLGCSHGRAPLFVPDPGSDPDTESDTGVIAEDLSFSHTLRASIDVGVQAVDLMLLLDTTGANTWRTLPALSDAFEAITAGLDVSMPDNAVGLATFEDYNYVGMGASTDLPFRLNQQISVEPSAVQQALGAVESGFGGDPPESTIEAIYQTLTGDGYDQQNDGFFDATTDVAPFSAHQDDLFAGQVSGTGNPNLDSGGSRGGVGFREGSLPVVLYFTDAALRDPEAGYATPASANQTAGSSDVVQAAQAIDAQVIAVHPTDVDSAAQSMLALGAALQQPVYQWSNAVGSNEPMGAVVLGAVNGAIDDAHFDKVTAVIRHDWGFKLTVSPPSYSNITIGSGPLSLPFEVHVEGVIASEAPATYYPMTLEVYSDGGALLGSTDISLDLTP